MTTLLNRKERKENLLVNAMTKGTVAEMLRMEDQMLHSAAESGAELRLWEPTDQAVVLGLGGKAEVDLDLDACAEEEIPVLRRMTGGGTVLQAPGILNVVLVERGKGGFSEARSLMARLAEALASALSFVGYPARAFGAGDVAELGPEARKLAGLASRGRGKGLLAHASILVEADLDLMERLLKHPRREPEYRRRRGHREFLGSAPGLKNAETRTIFARALARALFLEGSDHEP